MKALKTITCVLTFALLLILAPTQAKAVSNNVSATEGTFTVHQFIDGNEAGSLTIRAKGFDKTQTTSCRFGNIQWDVYTSSGTCKGASAVVGLNYTYKGSSDSSRYPVVGCHVGLTKPLGVVFEKASFDGNTQNVDAPFNVWEIPGFLFIQTQGSNLAFNAGVGEMRQFLNMQSCFDHYGLDFKTNPSLTCKAHWYPANVTVPKAPTAEKYMVTVANENATIDTAMKAKSFNGWNVNGSLYQPGEVVVADADFSTGVWGCSSQAYSIPGIRMTLFASGGKHK